MVALTAEARLLANLVQVMMRYEKAQVFWVQILAGEMAVAPTPRLMNTDWLLNSGKTFQTYRPSRQAFAEYLSGLNNAPNAEWGL